MKTLLIILLLFSGICSAQSFDPLTLQKMPQQRVLGRTGPTTGNATFIKLSSDFLIRNDSLLYVGSALDTSNAFVNFITRTPGVDSIYFNIGGTWYAILDSTGGGGMTNPMTTAGDIILGGASGTPGRLGIGANTYVLTSNGTTASWQAAAGGGGLIVGTSAISSGTATRVLFEGSGNVLQEDAGFTYDAATDLLTAYKLQVSDYAGGIAIGNSGAIESDGTNLYVRESAGVHIQSGGVTSILTEGAKVSIGRSYSTPTARAHIGAGTTAASTASVKIETGSFMTTPEAGALEYATPQLTFTNGTAIRQEIPLIQQTMVVTQFDKTSNTTLGDVTNLTANVAAGKTYRFEAKLYTSSGSSGGVKVAIGGTSSATTIVYEGLTTDAGLITQSRTTTMGNAVGGVTAVTAGYIVITGSITTDAAGTLTVQFAQNASDGTTSSVLWGSTFVVTQINY